MGDRPGQDPRPTGSRPRIAVSCLGLLAVLIHAGAAGAQTRAPARPASADFVSPGPVVALDAVAMAAIGGLKSQALATHIALLSSPALEGRGLASPGLEAAAEYVAAQLALAGIGPVDAPQGSPNPAAPYFHPVAVRQISRASCQVRIESRSGETTGSGCSSAGSTRPAPRSCVACCRRR